MLCGRVRKSICNRPIFLFPAAAYKYKWNACGDEKDKTLGVLSSRIHDFEFRTNALLMMRKWEETEFEFLSVSFVEWQGLHKGTGLTNSFLFIPFLSEFKKRQKIVSFAYS